MLTYHSSNWYVSMFLFDAQFLSNEKNVGTWKPDVCMYQVYMHSLSRMKVGALILKIIMLTSINIFLSLES